jgi:hypothetical protein
MFGGEEKDKKFVGKIINLAKERRELKIVNNKFGSPTYTRDFSKGIKRLIEIDLLAGIIWSRQVVFAGDTNVPKILESSLIVTTKSLSRFHPMNFRSLH